MSAGPAIDFHFASLASISESDTWSPSPSSKNPQKIYILFFGLVSVDSNEGQSYCNQYKTTPCLLITINSGAPIN